MEKRLMLIILLLGLQWAQAQSKISLLRNLDPILDRALDSMELGKPEAAISLLQRASTQFKTEAQWQKYNWSLLALGKIYFEINKRDSALLFLNAILPIAKEGGNDRLIAIAEEGIARIHLAKHEYPLALQHYRKFADWCLAHGKPKAKVETCLQMVQIYTRAVNPDSVMRYLRLGLSLADGNKFPVLKHRLLQLAGLGWNNINRPDSALYYFRKNLALFEKNPKPDREAVVYCCIAHVFLDNHNPQRAKKYLQQAQQLVKSGSLPFPKALVLYYEGQLLALQDKNREAILVFTRALQAFQQLPNPKRHQAMQARCLRALGEAHHNTGQDEKALAYLKQSKQFTLRVFHQYNEMQSELLEAAILTGQDDIRASEELLMENLVWAQKSDNLNYQIDLYETLAANERKKKNFEKAILYLDKVNALKKELDPVLQASLLSNEETQWEIGKKTKSIDNLKALNQTKSRRLQSTQLWAALLAATLLFLMWIYRHKRQQAIQLASEKQQVEASLKEKELLLKEIHHRVKNNMQVISSLLNLQARGVQDPIALKVMREGRDRVRSMALIHQTLYQNNDFSTVATEDYFLKLAENLFHTYNIAQDRVQLVAQIQPLKFNVDIMIALGLILNELISNTLKYAFPEEQKGVVHISLIRNAEQVELKVEDNGVGFPPNFVPDTARSIGFSLIHAFTQKLGGSLRINNVERGALASLIFPFSSHTHNATHTA